MKTIDVKVPDYHAGQANVDPRYFSGSEFIMLTELFVPVVRFGFPDLIVKRKPTMLAELEALFQAFLVSTRISTDSIRLEETGKETLIPTVTFPDGFVFESARLCGYDMILDHDSDFQGMLDLSCMNKRSRGVYGVFRLARMFAHNLRENEHSFVTQAILSSNWDYVPVNLI